MQNPLQTYYSMDLAVPYGYAASRSLNFSEEIDAQRRRKGSGPEGRAEAPVNRQDGGRQGGGGWQPSTGGGGGSGLKLPPWMIIIILILVLIFGGKGALGALLGGGSATDVPQEQAPAGSIDTLVPNVQSAPVVGFTPPAGSTARQLDGHALSGRG